MAAPTRRSLARRRIICYDSTVKTGRGVLTMAQTAHRSTTRVLDIFDLLANADRGHTLTEIAQKLSCPKSSLLPILQTLVARGYLDYYNNRYTIGLNLFAASLSYRQRITINRFICSEMRLVVSQVEESVCLGVLEGSMTRFIRTEECANPVNHGKTAGSTEVGPLGAVGKALLCTYTLDQLTDMVFKDNERLPESFSLYRAHIEMEEIRTTNLAYEYGEVTNGIQCIASPIRYRKQIVAALGIVLPTFRLSVKKVDEAVRSLNTGVRRIEGMLSSSGEDMGEVFSINGFRNL